MRAPTAQAVNDLLGRFGGRLIHELTSEEARELLDTFRKGEAETFKTLSIDGVGLDYSSQSVGDAIRTVAARFVTVSDNGAPVLDLWSMRLGYYFGEALCLASSQLFWTIGEKQYAFCNHPVIAGFSNKQEAPVVTICRNMLSSSVKGNSARVDQAVRVWFGYA